MKLSDYVAEFVASQGIRHVFTVPGGGAMHLNDSFFHNGKIECVFNLHEQASAMAAETYAKVTGGLGCGLFTTGPGGTNAITGLAGAWLDSTPCLYISGQAKRSDMKGDTGVRQMGLQEVDIVAVAKPLTKFAKTVMEPADIRRDLEEAVHIARQGRPGPVWIDIPLDVQGATIDPETLARFEPGPDPEAPTTDVAAAVDQVLALLAKALRPIVLAGNGVRLAGATETLHGVIETLGLPTMSTWLSVDLFAHDDPLYVGKPGTVAPRGVNFALQNSDFLLVLGARVDVTITGYAPERLAREAVKVMVDIDPAEMGKLDSHIDLAIHADAGEFLRQLQAKARSFAKPDWSAWMDRCRDWKAKYPIVTAEHRAPDQKVSVYRLAEVLSEDMPGEQIIVSGSSGAGIEIFQHVLRLKKGQRLLHTTALGAMGYGLPAAIGAAEAAEGRPIILVDGDGGLQMNIQELETVRRLNLPLKILVLSNEGYSSIRTSQQRWFGRLSGADETSGLTLPDMIKVATAYGLKTARIADQSNLREDLQQVLAMEGPVVCEVVTIPDEQRMPSMSSAQRKDGSLFSKPIEDLWPFLDREEFLANMIVAPVEE